MPSIPASDSDDDALDAEANPVWRTNFEDWMMSQEEDRRLRIGVLGAGQIAQAAHFGSCTKARNADLWAICEVADDLRERMTVTHGAKRSYAEYNRMLADPDVDAV